MRAKISWVIVGLFVGVGVWLMLGGGRGELVSPRGQDQGKSEKAYDKYSFGRLVERRGIASAIEIVGDKFYYYSEGRRISGEINVPQGESKGIIVMARGYVDKESYKTGVGTHNAARYYASHGYTTYAPDFSGYGESEAEDEGAIGARLVKPVEIMDLIASLPRGVPIYLWGHSNGGQIMLSVAEILRDRIVELGIKGVTLWAPVSKPFPYNVLYYTDEAEDQGKWLRGAIAQFEQDYDVYDYSIDRYWEWIAIPMVIHQGSSDDAVPKEWSDSLVATLKDMGKTVTYYVYPNADHNMRPSWDKVVERDVEWFNQLQKEE